MPTKTYSFGGFAVRINSEEPIADSGFFPLFRIPDDSGADYTVEVRRQELPSSDGAVVFDGGHRKTALRGGTVYAFTCFSDTDRPEKTPYACEVRSGADITLYIDYDG
ncbi:MAG: hypothetical protein K6C36_09010, partial [Clostridia bacterium]|nr:hypothetical protein [Clostridia bacterium]